MKLALVLLQSMVVASGKGHHKMLQQYTKKKRKKKRGRERPPCIPAKTGGGCADSKRRGRSRAIYNRKKGNAVYF